MKQVILTLYISCFLPVLSIYAQPFFPIQNDDKFIVNHSELDIWMYDTIRHIDTCLVQSVTINNKQYKNFWGPPYYYNYDSSLNLLLIHYVNGDKIAIDFNRTSGVDTCYYDRAERDFTYSIYDSVIAGVERNILKLFYSYSYNIWPIVIKETNYYKFAEGIGEVEGFYSYHYHDLDPWNEVNMLIWRSLLVLERNGISVVTLNSPPLSFSFNEDKADLSWGDYTQFEDGFILQRKQPQEPDFITLAIFPPNTTNYSDTTIIFGETNQYLLRSFRDTIYSYPDTIQVNAIVQPVNLTFSKPGYFKIALQWEYNSTFADGFIIERSLKQNNIWGAFQVLDSVGFSHLTYIDSTVIPGDSCSYRIKSHFNNLISVPSNTVKTAPDFMLLPPENLSVVINEYESAKINWTDPNNYQNTKFYLSRKTGAGSYINLVNDLIDTFYIDETVAQNSSYIYRIRAKLGAVQTAFAYSDTILIPPFIPVQPPQNIHGDTTEYGTVLISWEDHSVNEKMFMIGRGKTYGQLNIIDSVSLNTTVYEDSIPILYGNDREIFYGVRAKNPHSQSEWSVVQVITSIEDQEVESASYELQQNYPNPFNPVTIISFSIAKPEFVTLKVYNILGEELITLFNGELKAGRHKVNFDARNFSSGIYFYRLNAGNFSEVKKLQLLK